MDRIAAVVPAEADGQRLRAFARGSMGISYGQLSSLKMTGGLRVNGAAAHTDRVLAAGDLVEIVWNEEAGREITPEALPLGIVYEDEALAIIDKPAPLACQSTPRQPLGTLENRWAHAFPGLVFRPVNRLDKGTSGLMAAAKDAYTCQRLQRQLHTGRFLREYTAVVEGVLEGSGTIDLPVAKAEGATIRRCVDAERGRPAVTHWQALRSRGGRTLVRLRLETGRTHQIRVHLSAAGHPVCGDFLYGSELEALPGRFALHSSRIELAHPVSGRIIALSSPAPQALTDLLGTADSRGGGPGTNDTNGSPGGSTEQL